MNNLIRKNKKFFDRIAGYYDFLMKSWLGKVEEKILDIVNIKKNSKILDVGCGTGNLLLMLSKENKKLILYGVDISKEMLKIAGRKLGNKAELKLMQAEELSKLKESSFDYVFSTEAFHHYANQEKAMRNFYKLLKKRGKLIILDFDFGFFLNKIFHIIEPGNSRMNSASDFYKLFKKAGFKDIEQKKLGLVSIVSMGEK